MKSVFISDLHLSSDEPRLCQAFERFLTQLPEDVCDLYILGDLFEVWIGDDDPSDLATSVKAWLKRVSTRGVRLKIQHGNRDFMLGKRFSEETGADIIPDYYLFNNHGQTALLMHGDLLCTDDADYQHFRKKVRSPLYNFMLRNMPLKQRQKIARRWRMQSREMNQNKPEHIMDVNSEAVQQCMVQQAVNTLIHGHTHRPGLHRLDAGRQRIVLGDWGQTIWWIEADAQGFELLSKPLVAEGDADHA